ncbi:MAG: hypothetical protein WCS52_00355 [bacterium]
MFNKKSFWRQKNPIVKDDNLTTLLQEWQGINTGVTFETEVWSKIHRTSQPTTREWATPSLSWINAMAAAAGLVLGIGLAFNVPSTPDRNHAETSLLHAQTLAGSYLAMATGGIR